MLDFAVQAQESQRVAVNVALANGDRRVAELFESVHWNSSKNPLGG